MDLEKLIEETDHEGYEIPEVTKLNVGQVTLALKSALCSGKNALQQPIANFNGN